MTATEILNQLKTMGSESIKNVLIKHGAREPLYGVKVEDLKKIQKKIKKDHQLSLELFDTGVSDAMYLAGLIADEKLITKKDLENWANKASWSMICDYTVAWVAAESPYGWELGLEWIESEKENVACSGWNTLSSLVALKNDSDLDIPRLRSLLERVGKEIHSERNRVRYTMNNFVISVGGYVKELSALAKDIAKKIGKVSVNLGDTACKVPSAPEYIQKMIDRGTLGKKRKTVRC